MKTSDLFVRCLELEGIEYVFGVPGEENADFVMSLKQSDKIRFILTRHEQGAAFMAEAYGRLTGQPAGCLGTLGPGATNLLTGVANANMDHAPLLVLTGQGSTARMHKESHQIMDVIGMFRPITKWTTSIIQPAALPEIVRKALRLARSEKPGAVHLELPEDIAKRETDAEPIAPIRFRRPVPDAEQVDLAFDMLVRARCPVILAGNGCIRIRASQQLRMFCDATGVGVLSTFMAKGCVDMDEDYCLFTIGLGTKDLVTRAIDEADVVLTLGYDMVEYHPQLWNPDGSKTIIHADFEPAEIDFHYHPDVELVGDLAQTLAMLNERTRAHGPMDWDLGKTSRVRKGMLEEFALHKDDDAVGKLKPQKVLWDVREAMGPEDVVLSDVGAHKMWIARHYHCHEPNTCLIPNGFCSMGFALPGSIAAHLVHPNRNILAICGDGGFLMNVQEMETAKRLNADITAMVWVDGGYGLISWKQEQEFEQHTVLEFGNPDWMKLATAFGWHGHHVTESAALLPTLRQALEESGPSLIVVPIDYGENMRLTKHLGEIIRRV